MNNNESIDHHNADISLDKAHKPGWKAELWDWLKTIVVVFVVMSLLNVFVFNLSMVKGQSMQPTLEEKERLFINKIIYTFSTPKMGDIVVLRDPSLDDSKKDFLVKRVVGIPGDVVEVKEHQLYVNGQLQQEAYIDIVIEDADFEAVHLAEDQYFVMGDNRHLGESKDSRYFGSVSSDLIVGRAEFIFWPPLKIGGL
ncbi:signal peptidase I [Paenibacillus sp. CMAA1364]